MIFSLNFSHVSVAWKIPSRGSMLVLKQQKSHDTNIHLLLACPSKTDLTPCKAFSVHHFHVCFEECSFFFRGHNLSRQQLLFLGDRVPGRSPRRPTHFLGVLLPGQFGEPKFLSVEHTPDRTVMQQCRSRCSCRTSGQKSWTVRGR